MGWYFVMYIHICYSHLYCRRKVDMITTGWSHCTRIHKISEPLCVRGPPIHLPFLGLSRRFYNTNFHCVKQNRKRLNLKLVVLVEFLPIRNASNLLKYVFVVSLATAGKRQVSYVLSNMTSIRLFAQFWYCLLMGLMVRICVINSTEIQFLELILR